MPVLFLGKVEALIILLVSTLLLVNSVLLTLHVQAQSASVERFWFQATEVIYQFTPGYHQYIYNVCSLWHVILFTVKAVAQTLIMD